MDFWLMQPGSVQAAFCVNIYKPMEAYHNSRDLKFRSPFGAVTAGTSIELKIDTWNGTLSSAVLRVWTEGIGETRIDMEVSDRDGGQSAAASFTPDEPSLCWYRFELTDTEGNTFFYGSSENKKGGIGRIYPGDHDCPSYQITVSRERKVPDWYKKGIVYQIFPDRFAREAGLSDADVAARITDHKNGPVRRAVPWDKPVDYAKDAVGDIEAWDFYGGSLKGIREKLGYLRGLGISVLYLNPIFEAASNHRYDTGDYLTIDPVMGNEEDFKELCSEADKLGISIILDGVFNHTGCDSIYFNKFGNYPEVGAYQSESSKYRDWFSFNDNVPDGYDSWWGMGSLPNLREENEDLQKLIYKDKDSVVRKWMRLGAKGWRLDVADEMPDYYIAGIKEAALKEKSEDALIMGEVWEDASNKESYGEKRKYFQGDELDCVMNYPFRDGVCDFLTGKCSANSFAESMYNLLENYPEEAFYSNLNLIGSHDKMRVMSIFGEAPEDIAQSEKAAYKLDNDHRGLAKARLWLAALLQMTMPGVPCIYYGDEAGMEGYADPYNRGAFPWGSEDKDCRNIYVNAMGIRNSHKIFTDGDFEPFAMGKDVFGFTRRLGNEAVTVLINRSRSETQTVNIPRLGEYAADIVGGKVYRSRRITEYEARRTGADGSRAEMSAGRSDDTGRSNEAYDNSRMDIDQTAQMNQHAGGYDPSDEISITLNRLGSAVIYFSPEQRLGIQLEEGTGVLMHITSLPNDGKSGVLGGRVFKFIDLLKEKGDKYWQILPLNPTDAAGSPYAGSSAFAGNTRLLAESDEVLNARYNTYVREHLSYSVQSAAQCRDIDEYTHFIKENAFWLDAYAMFRALKARIGEDGWKLRADKYAIYSDALWDDAGLAGEADPYRYAQFIFDKTWHEVRSYAAVQGIQIIGDLPIYVSADSSDTWQYPDVFTINVADRLKQDKGADSSSKAEHFVAGVPPDGFSAEGQLWGNPLYNWDELKKTGYHWWIERLKRVFRLYDVVRLDHFRGFEAYWVIPEGRPASEGRWNAGPGRELFVKACEALGPLPVIAEDLGYITPGVRSLIASTGFPGMDVLQFCDGDPLYGYHPAYDRIAYTGTHDNETLLGWCRNRYSGKDADIENYLAAHDEYYLNREHNKEFKERRSLASRAADRLMKEFYACEAFIRIVPIQDLLGYGNEARMNVPGTVGTNWTWQAPEPDDSKGRCKRRYR